MAQLRLIGEEFDRDPFLLFRLRGMDRDEILPMLRAESPEAESADLAQRRLAARGIVFGCCGAWQERAIVLPQTFIWDSRRY